MSSEARADRGRLINEHATTGMRLVQLRAELPDVEKQARKTPRKDLLDEVAKVYNARVRVPNIRREIAELEKEHAAQRQQLVSLGHFHPQGGICKRCGEDVNYLFDATGTADTPTADLCAGCHEHRAKGVGARGYERVSVGDSIRITSGARAGRKGTVLAVEDLRVEADFGDGRRWWVDRWGIEPCSIEAPSKRVRINHAPSKEYGRIGTITRDDGEQNSNAVMVRLDGENESQWWRRDNLVALDDTRPNDAACTCAAARAIGGDLQLGCPVHDDAARENRRREKLVKDRETERAYLALVGAVAEDYRISREIARAVPEEPLAEAVRRMRKASNLDKAPVDPCASCLGTGHASPLADGPVEGALVETERSGVLGAFRKIASLVPHDSEVYRIAAEYASVVAHERRSDYAPVRPRPKFVTGDVIGYPSISDARYRVDSSRAEVRTYGTTTWLRSDGTEVPQSRDHKDGVRDITDMTLLEPGPNHDRRSHG